jgi:MerR family transcriptional regulator, copper efflux regulator
MRITEAARHLGTSPRMLRYRESLGLLPAVRERLAARERPGVRHPAHRKFGEDDLSAVGLGLAIEHRYDITPAALAFGLRVLAEPAVRAEVAELGRRIGRIPAPAVRALDFEQERALRLLELSQTRSPAPPRRSAPPPAQRPAQSA